MKSLFWFGNDLRLHDNPALDVCLSNSSDVEFIYCLLDYADGVPAPNSAKIGVHRKQFLLESLRDVKTQLNQFGLQLHYVYSAPLQAISEFIESHHIEAVYRTNVLGVHEQQLWTALQQRHDQVQFISVSHPTLFEQEQIDENKCKGSFSKFRKFHEPLPVTNPIDNSKAKLALFNKNTIDENGNSSSGITFPNDAFIGGETAALSHVEQYFSSDLPRYYKETRNELDGWDNSSKFSAWLANGCLSVRTLYQAICQYESEHEANESTYWLKFELLWREFFYWHGLAFGKALFVYRGVRNKNPLTSYYPERLKRWQLGQTPFPVVNAIMHQLVETGYISNRARQIAASCFVNELELDWRYGAMFFQRHLIDFDLASNFGNWQYIAGVGCDPRGGRHFNLDKQASLYDPNGEYVLRWCGLPAKQLDSTDMVDWPIYANS